MISKPTLKKRTIPTETIMPYHSQNGIEQPTPKKAPFGRKRQIDDPSHERLPVNNPNRQPREHTSLHKNSSFDELKLTNSKQTSVGEIKYLSPHFTRNNFLTSPSLKKGSETVQKFVRRPGNFPESLKDRPPCNNLLSTFPPGKI
jgi:hypothetical protein